VIKNNADINQRYVNTVNLAGECGLEKNVYLTTSNGRVCMCDGRQTDGQVDWLCR